MHYSSKKFALKLTLALSIFAVVVMGHMELIFPDAQKNIRISLIFFIFFCAVVSFILALSASLRLHFVLLNIFFCIAYSFVIAVVRGEAVGAFSSVLRLITFGLVAAIVYKTVVLDDRSADIYIARFFVTVSVLVIGQTVYDFATDRYVFMNGGDRYFGSVGSPIGFAASTLTLLTGVLYYWLRFGRSFYLLLGFGLVWVTLMTGTRSIALFALCLVWYASAVFLTKWRRCIFILSTPMIVLVAILLLSNSDFATRLENTYSAGGLDNSTSFRVFILDTYFSKISLREIVYGLGLGGFHQWFLEKTGIENVAPHFEVLWVLAEFGIVGVVVYIVTATALLIKFFRLKYRDASLWFGFMTIGSLHQLFLQVANPFYFYQFYLPYAILLGLLLSRLRTVTDEKKVVI